MKTSDAHIPNFEPNGHWEIVVVLWLSTFAGTVLISGCESTVGLDIPPKEPELAVFCLFSPGQPWTVNVHNTFSLADTSVSPLDWAITDARVEITHEGSVVVEPRHTSNGIYIAETPAPSAGRDYTLRVSAPGFPAVQATDRIRHYDHVPRVAFVDSAKYVRERREYQYEVKISFEDPAGETNFYSIETGADYGAGMRPTSYYTDDPVLTNTTYVSIFGKGDGQASVFDDASFNGSTFETAVLDFRYPMNAIEVQLLQVSEAYYRYGLSIAQIQAAEDNPFAEPVRPFSNIENGQGVFAGFSRHPAPIIALNEIDIEHIAGAYLSQFIGLRKGGTTVAVLPDQASIRLKLDEDGSASGHFFMTREVNAADPAQEIDADLSGRFTYDGRYVRFSMTPATFLNEYLWNYDRNVISTEQRDTTYFVAFTRVREVEPGEGAR